MLSMSLSGSEGLRLDNGILPQPGEDTQVGFWPAKPLTGAEAQTHLDDGERNMHSINGTAISYKGWTFHSGCLRGRCKKLWM